MLLTIPETYWASVKFAALKGQRPTHAIEYQAQTANSETPTHTASETSPKSTDRKLFDMIDILGFGHSVFNHYLAVQIFHNCAMHGQRIGVDIANFSFLSS